ncbi:MAG: polysaccharide export protein [Rubrivivax sp.]|nr:polysaccharide export protein [Rubrivivax sp.]
MPTTGPSAEEVISASPPGSEPLIQLVDVNGDVARRLGRQRGLRLFSEVLGQAKPRDLPVGPGDTVEVTIWESPPATLFGGSSIDPRIGVVTARPAALPEQTVDTEGKITVPFAGRIQAAGKTTQVIATEIVSRLQGKANQPEVIVRVTRNASSTVTVVGEVATSIRMPLSAGGERLLDALAAAGGVRQPVAKTTIQVTRGQSFHALPLDSVIQDPRQNVPLHPGDVVTAIFQPLSFTALGATGKNDEISFEAQGISLAQALARVGGLVDTRSDAQGVFIFRFEDAAALDWPRQPVSKTPEGKVAVVYRVDLRNPQSFFVMQSFGINHRDILYVSNAPLAETQKFLNLVFSVAFPVLNTIDLFRGN